MYLFANNLSCNFHSTLFYDRATFNKTANDLCLKLLELDKVVAQSVADQVAETFVDPSSAINNLISAAVAPPPPSYPPPDPDSEEVSICSPLGPFMILLNYTCTYFI